MSFSVRSRLTERIASRNSGNSKVPLLSWSCSRKTVSSACRSCFWKNSRITCITYSLCPVSFLPSPARMPPPKKTRPTRLEPERGDEDAALAFDSSVVLALAIASMDAPRVVSVFCRHSLLKRSGGTVPLPIVVGASGGAGILGAGARVCASANGAARRLVAPPIGFRGERFMAALRRTRRSVQP